MPLFTTERLGKSFGDELFFRRLGVNEENVGVATPSGVERLTGALCHDLDLDAGLLGEERQNVVEKPGIPGRRG